MLTLGRLEPISHPEYTYVVTEPYTFRWENKDVAVEKGFLTDGSTCTLDFGSAWLFHDYLYATHRFSSGEACTREEADRVMQTILERENLNYKSWLLKTFKWCCCFRRAWSRSGLRGPQYRLLQDKPSKWNYS